jgi:hypothetical protein
MKIRRNIICLRQQSHRVSNHRNLFHIGLAAFANGQMQGDQTLPLILSMIIEIGRLLAGDLLDDLLSLVVCNRHNLPFSAYSWVGPPNISLHNGGPPLQICLHCLTHSLPRPMETDIEIRFGNLQEFTGFLDLNPFDIAQNENLLQSLWQ